MNLDKKYYYLDLGENPCMINPEVFAAYRAFSIQAVRNYLNCSMNTVIKKSTLSYIKTLKRHGKPISITTIL